MLLRPGMLLRAAAIERPGLMARAIVRRVVYLSIMAHLVETSGSRFCRMASNIAPQRGSADVAACAAAQGCEPGPVLRGAVL